MISTVVLNGCRNGIGIEEVQVLLWKERKRSGQLRLGEMIYGDVLIIIIGRFVLERSTAEGTGAVYMSSKS